MKKGVRPAPSSSVEVALLIANSASERWSSQSSLRPFAYARSVSLMTPFARSTLALVFLWYAEPTMRHEPMHLTKARKTSTRELCVVVYHEHVGEAGSGPKAHFADDQCRSRSRRCRQRGGSMYLARQEVNVVLDHIKSCSCRW